MKNRSKTHAVSANKNNNTDADLARRVRSGEFRVAVYGLGHVGSPLASSWLRAGAHVIGVDNSPEVLKNARK
jgi:UDP-N-acetyl-D-mannosaminuronate dehydrogenase